MKDIQKIVNFLIKQRLILTTAESCTAGRVIHLLSKIENCGECLDAGFVVYSAHAKKRLLGVNQKTITKYTLTSEPVAKQMAKGALKESQANIAVATTGIAGSEPMDGIEPGTICFAWGFKCKHDLVIYSKTVHFDGGRERVQNSAAKYALLTIPRLCKQLEKDKFKIAHAYKLK